MRYIDIEGVVRTRMMTDGEIDDEDRECSGYKKGTARVGHSPPCMKSWHNFDKMEHTNEKIIIRIEQSDIVR